MNKKMTLLKRKTKTRDKIKKKRGGGDEENKN